VLYDEDNSLSQGGEKLKQKFIKTQQIQFKDKGITNEEA
jgi:hypothetical protein